MRGIFEEGDEGHRGGDMEELKNWLIGKMLWDPTLDPEALIQQFLAGYFGEAPGVPAIVPAGSVVVFSSLSFHRSGPNTTDQMRRAYVTQYSPEILRRPGETEPMHLGVPFLENGRRILTQ